MSFSQTPAAASTQRFPSVSCMGLPVPNINAQAAEEVETASKKIPFTIITSDLLIPGDGDPLTNGTVVSQGKLIVWVGPKSDLPEEYTRSKHKSYHVPYMMPGLWDCHVHFMATPNDPDEQMAAVGLGPLSMHPTEVGARLTKECWTAIQRGYTSLRDCAGYGCEMSKAVEDGGIVGPNIYSVGSALSQTAGHGDSFAVPPGDALLNFGVSSIAAGYHGSGVTCLVDGVDECRRGIRLQIRRGAKCIKILASGGVLSRDDNPLYAQFCKEELEAMVEEASRMDRTVAAHVHGKPGILAAARAGVSSVEHVTFADQECVDLLKEKDIIYVATRTIVTNLVNTGGVGLPKKIWEKVKLTNSNHLNAYKLAIKNNVKIALGTDTMPGDAKAQELQYAVEAGMTNLEAIKAATATAALTVKGQAPLTGQIKVGYEADIIGVLENPVEDVRVLQPISNIGWVWKGGRLFKGPNIGPWGEDA